MRANSVVWAYAALTALFLGGAWLRLPYGEGLRFPTLLIERNAEQNVGGWVPAGLPQLDQARLRRSVARISTVRLAREAGNSVRVAGGQVVEWAIWGGQEPLMLFPNLDLWVSRGLTPEVEADLVRAAQVIGAYEKRLKQEGWTLVVLAVPAKLGTHRELARWPIGEANLLSRDLVLADRSDAVHGFFIEKLAREGVPAVDLQSLYRSAIARRPETLLFVPGDSHWTGVGIELAANATAQLIARSSTLVARVPRDPTYLEFDHVGDMAKVFDPLPALNTWLKPVWTYRERLLNGEAGRGYPYPQKPSGLVAAVGTSYTGQYTWLAQPVGFAWQLGLHLDNVEVQNLPHAGQGSFFAFELFWKRRNEIYAEFSTRHGPGKPKVVVWEFPLRDVRGMLTAPPPN
ncbi:alginate O-acetyltransferase AlgX-related protein [Usitatibacter palustris]|uniref:AlgX/AlgJ SGNH hydrolase-like domain-containing protein n=1 Tax=Usitatibacter palustris TaxID=2732487 RepID=A0A6M4HBB0_9PROT|nr:hypothetical protein [Usitatibacter palustris]QJR16502.1 hypothetical protein DSM104440_03337 [Usitatibacter palustris]